jgi:hypothetical protein
MGKNVNFGYFLSANLRTQSEKGVAPCLSEKANGLFRKTFYTVFLLAYAMMISAQASFPTLLLFRVMS